MVWSELSTASGEDGVMNPDEIRKAVETLRRYPIASSVTTSAITTQDAALAFADSLDDPIWWCFKHDATVIHPYEWCEATSEHDTPCDIAKATRPRRIE